MTEEEEFFSGRFWGSSKSGISGKILNFWKNLNFQKIARIILEVEILQFGCEDQLEPESRVPKKLTQPASPESRTSSLLFGCAGFASLAAPIDASAVPLCGDFQLTNFEFSVIVT